MSNLETIAREAVARHLWGSEDVRGTVVKFSLLGETNLPLGIIPTPVDGEVRIGQHDDLRTQEIWTFVQVGLGKVGVVRNLHRADRGRGTWQDKDLADCVLGAIEECVELYNKETT